jgi:hypothetical protein
LRYLFLPVVAYGLQVISVRVPAVALSTELSRIGIVISYLLLLAFVMANWRHLAILVIGLGLAMNFAAILANGGFMPVTVEAAIRSGYEETIAGLQIGETVPMTISVLLERSATHLWFLSDIFSIRSPLKYMFSVGDVLIATSGVFLLGQAALSSRIGCRKRSTALNAKFRTLSRETK